jgi:hypothetical protein
MEGFASSPLPMEKQLALVSLGLELENFDRDTLVQLYGAEVDTLILTQRAIRTLAYDSMIGGVDPVDHSLDDELSKLRYIEPTANASAQELRELICAARKSRYGHETYAASFSQPGGGYLSDPFYQDNSSESDTPSL